MPPHFPYPVHRPTGDEDDDPTSGDVLRSCDARCCTIFCISVTFTGFVICLLSGLYFLLIEQRSTYFPFFLFCALICLAALIHVITIHGDTLRTSRSESSYPFDTQKNFEELLRRSQMGGVRIQIPGHAEPTLSLPAYILIPERRAERRESPSASTESTLSAEENREGLDEEAAGATPLVGEALGEATETLVNVVDETLYGRGGAEEAAEGGSELSAEARRVLLQGVRQRRQPPMEPRKDVPSSEDEKTQ